MTHADRAPAGAAPRPIDCGIGGFCPRCGARTLFAGLLRFADRCAACGLDIAAFNVGDGPAALLVLGWGAVVVALAITVEPSLSPPWWLYVLLWVPLTAAGVVWSLRAAKGWLLAVEFRTAAREGRIAS